MQILKHRLMDVFIGKLQFDELQEFNCFKMYNKLLHLPVFENLKATKNQRVSLEETR